MRWLSAAFQLAAITGLAAVLASACGQLSPPAHSPTGALGRVSASPSSGNAASGLTVFAAASLKDAFTALAVEWAKEHPNTSLTFSFDASSALEAQLEQGAPVDVFASADARNAQMAIDHGFALAPVVAFAGNQLTIVVPRENPAHVTDPLDLARPGLRLVAASDSVPITRYADQAIQKLAAQPGYPEGYAAAVDGNIVSREDNVRAVLTRIELGEADAAIVYVTDARTSTEVATIAIPEMANVLATYAAVVAKASAHRDGASAFVTWLASPSAQRVLAQFGFLPPPG